MVDLIGPGGVLAIAIAAALWALKPLLEQRLRGRRDRRELRSYGYGRRARR